MTTDSLQNERQPSSILEQHNIATEPSNGKAIAGKSAVILNNAQFLEFQEKVFSIISENNGKLIFADLYERMGEAPYKPVLYKALMNLARQQRIVRIRGIGKHRIEFYYYDTKKLRKVPPSASVRYASL
jgi:hypothetical protein